MSPTHFKVRSLSGKIFTSVLAFTLGVIVVLAFAMTTIYYVTYEHDAEGHEAAPRRGGLPQRHAVFRQRRGARGAVLGIGALHADRLRRHGVADSAVDPATMENHADRPRCATPMPTAGP
ncbi:MAG: hypothetical protein ACLSVD_15995 [Eggerthellaceae bacterium]